MNRKPTSKRASTSSTRSKAPAETPPEITSTSAPKPCAHGLRDPLAVVGDDGRAEAPPPPPSGPGPPPRGRCCCGCGRGSGDSQTSTSSSPVTTTATVGRRPTRGRARPTAASTATAAGSMVAPAREHHVPRPHLGPLARDVLSRGRRPPGSRPGGRPSRERVFSTCWTALAPGGHGRPGHDLDGLSRRPAGGRAAARPAPCPPPRARRARGPRPRPAPRSRPWPSGRRGACPGRSATSSASTRPTASPRSDLLAAQGRRVGQDDLESALDGDHDSIVPPRARRTYHERFGEGGLVRTVVWEDGAVVMIDQRRLPPEEVYLRCRDHHEVAAGIRDMAIRGAPAIGVAAAFGIALGVRPLDRGRPCPAARARRASARSCASTRPTAVNLFWAIERMRAGSTRDEGRGGPVLRDALLEEAQRDPRRGRGRLPPHGRPGRGPGPAGRAHPHPLQRGRPGHRGLRDGPGRGALRGGPRARSGTSSPTRPARTCRGRGSPPGS